MLYPPLHPPPVEHLLTQLEGDDRYADTAAAVRTHLDEVARTAGYGRYTLGDVALGALVGALAAGGGCVALVRGWF